MQGRLDFADPEVVFNYLFGNDEFMKRFHKKINHDPYAEASIWNKNNEREVKYIASAEAPKMISKLTGESFPVKEVQKYFKNRNCYTITCDPVIESPSGDRFVTYAETVLLPDESGGCAVTSNVTLEFKGGIWGLEGAIESFMEGKARTTFDQWMTTAKLFCQEKLAQAGAGEPDGNHECFFDAEEVADDNSISYTQTPDRPTPANRILSRFRSTFSGATDNTLGLDTYFTQTILREVNDIQISCEAIKGHLVKLNTNMLKMEEDISFVRSAFERQQASISRSRQLTLLGVGMATGFALGFMCARLKRQVH